MKITATETYSAAQRSTAEAVAGPASHVKRTKNARYLNHLVSFLPPRNHPIPSIFIHYSTLLSTVLPSTFCLASCELRCSAPPPPRAADSFARPTPDNRQKKQLPFERIDRQPSPPAAPTCDCEGAPEVSPKIASCSAQFRTRADTACRANSGHVSCGKDRIGQDRTGQDRIGTGQDMADAGRK